MTDHSGHRRQVDLGIRCGVCQANLDAHKRQMLVRCINPECRVFEKWLAVPVVAR